MAFKIEKNGKKGPIADINVTPLVDVVLVLLIIFMLTAPLLFNGIQLNLPKTKEVNKVNLTAKQVILSMTRTGDLFLGKDKILKTELLKEVQSLFQKNNTQTLYIRADFAIKYGEVASLMSFLKRGGVTQIALVTETDKDLPE